MLWTREIDLKIVVVSSIFAVLAAPAVLGYILPNPLETFSGRVLNSAISLAVGVFAWACFRLAEPKRFGPGWSVAKLIGIPALWLLLFLGIAFGFTECRRLFLT
jgi:hypothetical protein